MRFTFIRLDLKALAHSTMNSDIAPLPTFPPAQQAQISKLLCEAVMARSNVC